MQSTVSAPTVAAQPGARPSEPFDGSSLNACAAITGGRFVHYCQHPGCPLWGSVGFGVHLRGYATALAKEDPNARRWLGKWFCPPHAADFKAQRQKQKPATVAPAPVPKEAQGKFL